MDRIPRFRRRPKHPTIKTDARPQTATATPARDPSASSSSDGAAPAPALGAHTHVGAVHTPHRRPERFLKVAALKGLHLRSPGKRARSPTPASSAEESPPPVVTLDAVADRGDSPVGTSGTSEGSAAGSEVGVGRRESRKRVKGRAGGGAVGMPAFLSLSDADLMNKFQDIIWMERNRLAFGPCTLEHVDVRPGPGGSPDPKRAGMDRYCNIKPWSHNRVRLRVGPESLDYVNASPIALGSASDPELPPLRYIAMQGPTRQSLEYVWRMVAEQLGSDVVVVQLTNMVEHGVRKCHPYFPGEGEEPWRVNPGDEWGDGWAAEVSFEETTRLAGGAIELTRLRLRVAGEEGPGRTVWHFLYTRWPDFGVPAMEDLGSFFELMRLSREYGGEGEPRVVHCSAGVGRTGTFISLEHLVRELEGGGLEGRDGEAEGPDPVFETVDELRSQRKSMVQAEAQFLFVYRVLRKLWEDRYGDGEPADEGGGSGKA